MNDTEIRRYLLDLDDTLCISEGEQVELNVILRNWGETGGLTEAARKNAERICQKHPDRVRTA